jgi:hypothetical protein
MQAKQSPSSQGHDPASTKHTIHLILKSTLKHFQMPPQCQPTSKTHSNREAVFGVWELLEGGDYRCTQKHQNKLDLHTA